MQIFTMIWSGINGHGAGTIFLKGLFIIALAGIFWITCELAKHLVNVFAKLIVEGLRYLAIMARGWPKQDDEKKKEGNEVLHYRTNAENPEEH
jgi:hypothetical protein